MWRTSRVEEVADLRDVMARKRRDLFDSSDTDAVRVRIEDGDDYSMAARHAWKRWSAATLLILGWWIAAPWAFNRLSAAQAHEVTFAQDVAPILYARCAICHRDGGSAPFPLITYASAKQHARQVADVTRRRYMPPS